MKFPKALTLILAFNLSVSCANAQVSSPDTMIHKLFATLKAKDEKAFVALYPTGAQFGRMMRGMMEGLLNSEQMKQMMAMDPKSKDLNIDSLINTEVDKMSKPEVFADMQKSFGKKFQDIIEQGEKKGVKWNTAKLVTYTTDTTAAVSQEMEMFKASGIKNMKGVIDFTAGDSAYQMSFDKLIFIPAEGGWFGGEFDEVIRKGESFSSKEATGQTSDSIDSVSVEMPKGKKPIRTAPSGIKSKPKTKTPARKPAVKS